MTTRSRPVGAATQTPIETMPISRALNAGLRRALAENDRVLLMGEDIGTLGGVFRVTEGLQAEFGDRRVLDTPLAESGIVGTAIGLAMAGFRPVCEIQFDGFVFPAFDQITSQLAKFTNRHEGALQHARRHPHPLRRAHRRGRAPPGEPGGVLHAHPGPARRQPVDAERRVLDDPGRDRARPTR